MLQAIQTSTNPAESWDDTEPEVDDFLFGDDFQWPNNYHLLLNPTEEKLFLRPYFNPMEWDPLGVEVDIDE